MAGSLPEAACKHQEMGGTEGKTSSPDASGMVGERTESIHREHDASCLVRRRETHHAATWLHLWGEQDNNQEHLHLTRAGNFEDIRIQDPGSQMVQSVDPGACHWHPETVCKSDPRQNLGDNSAEVPPLHEAMHTRGRDAVNGLGHSP